MPAICLYRSSWRILRELDFFNQRTPSGMSLDGHLQAERHFKICYINVQGAEGTLYDGEQFKLQFKFNYTYPFEAPEVSFVGQNIPVHPQVDNDGRICLSILINDWTPEFTVHSICTLIMSMLSSCKEKEIPKDDTEYVPSGKKKQNDFFNKDGCVRF